MPTESKFSVGDRVRARNKLKFIPLGSGTVRTLVGYHVAVEWDLGSLGYCQASDIEHVNPLEELAALGAKTKSNPLTAVPKVGDRVRIRKGTRGWGGETVQGKLVRIEARGPVYAGFIVEVDGHTCGDISFNLGDLEVLTPLEELASLAAEAKKNPHRFEAGDRVWIIISYKAKASAATVVVPQHLYRGGSSGLCLVQIDGEKESVRSVYELQRMTELEMLADLGRVKKNPRRDLEVGDSVRVRVSLKIEEIGTVSKCVSRYAVWVKLDSGSEILRGVAEVTRLSPTEMLARLGKEHKAKNNPRVVFRVGDRVKVTAFGYGKTKYGGGIGTVQVAPLPPDRHENYQVLLDGWAPAVILAAWELESVGPLEELAELGRNTQKNPETGPLFEIGERVRLTAKRIRERGLNFAEFRNALGTVVSRSLSGDRGGVYTVDWDVRGLQGAKHVYAWEIEGVSPLEELALTTKKNPKALVQAGDRVLHVDPYNSKNWEVGTFVRRDRASGGWKLAIVDIEYGSFPREYPYTTSVFPESIKTISPLEELALLGKGAKKNPGPRAFEVGDRVYVIETGQPVQRGTITCFPSATHPTWPEVKLDIDGSVFISHPRMLRKLSGIELLAEIRTRKNPKLSYADAKKQVLASLAGLPQSQRIDGKCLLANTTLCGLAGGRLVIGIANHREFGPVQHIWVVDGQGQVQDALSAWYSGNHEDPAQARVLGEAWLAAQDGVQDVANGMDIIAFWRRHRGV